MSEEKTACLVYVAATANRRSVVKAKLQQNGYKVHEVKAELADAVAAKLGTGPIPDALAKCIQEADLCVFLLPEAQDEDGTLAEGATFASQLGKRIVGLVDGGRHQYPDAFNDNAASMIRSDSVRLDEVISGRDVWEKPDRSLVHDRPIRHVRCQ